MTSGEVCKWIRGHFSHMLAGKETHLKEVSVKIIAVQMFSFLAGSSILKNPSTVFFNRSFVHLPFLVIKD